MNMKIKLIITIIIAFTSITALYTYQEYRVYEPPEVHENKDAVKKLAQDTNNDLGISLDQEEGGFDAVLEKNARRLNLDMYIFFDYNSEPNFIGNEHSELKFKDPENELFKSINISNLSYETLKEISNLINLELDNNHSLEITVNQDVSSVIDSRGDYYIDVSDLTYLKVNNQEFINTKDDNLQTYPLVRFSTPFLQYSILDDTNKTHFNNNLEYYNQLEEFFKKVKLEYLKDENGFYQENDLNFQELSSKYGEYSSHYGSGDKPSGYFVWEFNNFSNKSFIGYLTTRCLNYVLAIFFIFLIIHLINKYTKLITEDKITVSHLRPVLIDEMLKEILIQYKNRFALNKLIVIEKIEPLRVLADKELINKVIIEILNFIIKNNQTDSTIIVTTNDNSLSFKINLNTSDFSSLQTYIDNLEPHRFKYKLTNQTIFIEFEENYS